MCVCCDCIYILHPAVLPPLKKKKKTTTKYYFSGPQSPLTPRPHWHTLTCTHPFNNEKRRKVTFLFVFLQSPLLRKYQVHVGEEVLIVDAALKRQMSGCGMPSTHLLNRWWRGRVTSTATRKRQRMILEDGRNASGCSCRVKRPNSDLRNEWERRKKTKTKTKTSCVCRHDCWRRLKPRVSTG